MDVAISERLASAPESMLLGCPLNAGYPVGEKCLAGCYGNDAKVLELGEGNDEDKDEGCQQHEKDRSFLEASLG